MKKFFFIFLVLFISILCFSSEKAINNDLSGVFDLDSIAAVWQDNTNSLIMTPVAFPGNKELAVYKDLFFGLTVAFGVATFTFLAAGISVGVCYGISNKMLRDNRNDEDTYNKWYDAQTGLLAGTIVTWSLFTVFAVCGTAMGIIYMMSVPTKTAMKKSGKTRVGIRPTIKDVSLIVSYTL